MNEETSKGGRPTKWDDTFIDAVYDYIATLNDDVKSPEFEFPSVEGFAIYLGVSRDTIHEWKKVHPGFSDSIKYLLTIQGQRLQNGAITNRYNATTANRILAVNHGMHEKVDTDLTTKGEKVNFVFDPTFKHDTVTPEAKRDN